MCGVDWLTLLSTAVGGAVALLGSLLAHALRTRDERSRTVRTDRRQGYVEYLIALDAAHALVRQLADPSDPVDDLPQRSRRAFGEAGVYEAREKLLLSANPSVVSPAEQALRRLAELRDAVREGTKLYTMPYHEAHHRYAGALWRLRGAIRIDLGQPALSADDLDKQSWDEQATCDFCQKHMVPAQAAP
jgi:hypothetical protein